MAGRGPAPSSTHTRAGNDKKLIRVIADGRSRGPALPSNVLRDREGYPVEWHPMTRKWWNHWRKSPQAMRMMTDPDWDFLLDTALMHHQMWAGGRWELAAEVRLRVQKFGATPDDRSRLGIEVSSPSPSEVHVTPTPGATVTSMADRRSRIAADG